MWEDGKAGGRRAIAKNNNVAIANTDIERQGFCKLQIARRFYGSCKLYRFRKLLNLNFIDTTNKNIF